MAGDNDKQDKNDTDTEPKKDDLGDGGKKALDAERKARRDAEKKASDLEKQLSDLEDKDKPEVARLTKENAELKKNLDTATVTGARFKVALAKGLTATQAKRLVGDTEDELSADADEMLTDLGLSKKGGDGGSNDGADDDGTDGGTDKSGGDRQDRKGPPSSKPREALKAGKGDPDGTVDETDPAKLAAEIPRR